MVGAGVVLSAGLVSAVSFMAPAAAAAGAPPADSSAVGAITLCGQNGQQITSGSISAKPVVWRAVDTTAAPKGYGEGGTATLFAYQPRPQVPPGDWSGEQLTASARYTNPSHPMAAATVIDESLASYFGDYPLSPLGLIQLRIYLGSPKQPPYSILYDATYLRVSNGRWTQLSPGPADCSTSGSSVSVETLTLPKKDFKVKPTPGATQQPGADGTAAPDPGATQSAGASAVSASNSPDASGATSSAASSGPSHTGRNLGIVIALAVVIAAGGALTLRHRT